MTKKTMDTLLEIAELIALSDGTISKEEAQLIRDLPQQLSVDTVEADLVHPAEGSTLRLKELVEALTSHEERCLAAAIGTDNTRNRSFFDFHVDVHICMNTAIGL